MTWLAGAVVLAAVAGLVWVLRRWFDPLPGALIGVGLVLVGVLFGPVLWGGHTQLATDQLRFLAPFSEAVAAPERPTHPLQSDVVFRVVPALAQARAAFGRGEWPLWNPAVGAGQSLLGNASAQAFQPLQLLGLVLPLPQAVGVVAALRVLGALFFTFLYLRRLGLGPLAASFGGGLWALSGFTTLWLAWPVANVAAGLPLALYALTLAAQEARARDLGLLGFAVFTLATAGGGQTAGYCLVLLAAAAVLEVRREAPAARARRFLPWVLAALAGLAAAAPVGLATADFNSDTLTRVNLDGRVSAFDDDDPLGLLALSKPAGRAQWLNGWVGRSVPNLAPDALGNSRAGHYWGAANSNEDAAGFVGTVGWFLGLLAALHVARRGAGAFPHERLMAVTAGLVLVVAARPPVVVSLLEHLPLLGASPTLHQRATALLAFALAVLAACTLERWLSGRQAPRRWAWAAGLLALGGLILWAYLAHPAPQDATLLAGLRQRSLAVQLGALALAAVALGVGSRGRALRWGLPLLGVAELLSFHLPVNRSAPVATYFPTPPLIAYLQAHTAPGERIAGLGGALPPETAAIYGLADARYLGSEHPAFYEKLTRPITRAKGRYLTPGTFARANLPLLDLLGVRYVITPPGVKLPQRVVMEDASGRIFHREAPLPRLFLPAAAEPYRAELGPWEDWTAANPDFAAVSLVRRAEEGDGSARWRAQNPAASSLALTFPAVDRLSAQAQLAEPRWLASSVFQDDGWRLLANGTPVPGTIANGPLFAAWLPAGELQLELLYRPAALVVGALLAAFGLALAVALVLTPPALREEGR